jgi:N-acetylmuramoyl-L-alanine amidase
MKSSRLPSLFCLLAFWAFPAGVFAQGKLPWEPKKIGEKSYLPVDQISRFYGLEEPKREGQVIALESKQVRVTFETGSSVCIMNGIKFVLEEPVKEVDGVAHVSQKDLSRVLDPVLRPAHIKDRGLVKTVILDPADGGEEEGVANELGTSAGYSLQIAKLVAKKLEEHGYKVLLTREEDIGVPLQKRLDVADSVKDDAIFISITFTSGGKDVRGIETMPLTYSDDPLGPDGNAVVDFRTMSIALATGVHGSVVSRLGKNTADRGIKTARHSVFRKIKHPAILIKGGYLTHDHEAKLIHNETYQETLAKAIAEGVSRYRGAVGR